VLNSLPDSDIIAIHAFAHFVTIECHKTFFNMNSSFIEDDELLATLSIDHEGNVIENAKGDFPVVFNLRFDMTKLERRAAKPFKSATPMTEEEVIYMHFCDSLFEQITPQIYSQSLLLKKDLTALKEHSLSGVERLSKENGLDVYKLYYKIMMPLLNVVDNNKQKAH
jgi:hypothetical protein